MPAPSTQMTTQQIRAKQAQQQQSQAQTQQMYQKWYSIFTNVQVCHSYIKFNGSNTIDIPTDNTERDTACKAAQAVVNMYTTERKANTNEISNDPHEICLAAAKKFLRKCSAYVKTRSQNNAKQIYDTMKQGQGVASYANERIIPATQNLTDVKQAACNAGRTAALYELQARSQNPEDVKKAQQNFNNLMQSINGTLTGDKRYNTYFFFTYLTTIAGENKDGKMLDVGKNTGYQTNEEEMERKQNLNYLISKVQAYEKELHPVGQFEKPKDTNQYFQQQRLISDRQPYSQTGGRQ